MSDYKKILSRAARMCSKSEKCASDVYRKIQDWGLDEDEADKAIKYLIDNKYLDDNRFAEFFVKDKFRINKWGKIKINYALRQKNISEDIIENAMAVIKLEDYRNTLDELLRVKARKAGDISEYSEKAKLLRFGAQRGFETDEIYNALERIKED